MDMIDKNNDKNRLVKGKKQVLRCLAGGQNFESVFLAHDTDERFREEILNACRARGISCSLKLSRDELKSMAGIDVPCGVIAKK